MSVVCEACGASNRATAMFCIGCAGRLPAFVATGPSALEAMGVSPSGPPRVATAGADEPRPVPRAGSRAGAGKPGLWWALGLAGLAGLALAVWQVQGQPPAKETAAIGIATGATDRTARNSAPVPAAASETPLEAAPSPQEWLDKAEELVDSVMPRLAGAPPSPPALAPLVPSPLERNDIGPEAPARVVAAFYGALAAGDGKAAAAVVTPSKRDVGRFSEAGMTQFYGSFREPLSVRSIRQIDAHAVEARYTYRATRTVCEGVALVRTERVADQTVIRSIRANC